MLIIINDQQQAYFGTQRILMENGFHLSFSLCLLQIINISIYEVSRRLLDKSNIHLKNIHQCMPGISVFPNSACRNIMWISSRPYPFICCFNFRSIAMLWTWLYSSVSYTQNSSCFEFRKYLLSVLFSVQMSQDTSRLLQSNLRQFVDTSLCLRFCLSANCKLLIIPPLISHSWIYFVISFALFSGNLSLPPG